MGEPCPWPLVDVLDKIEWHRSCGSKQLGVLIPALVALFNVKTAIEIGIANGFTTQALGLSLAAVNPNEGLLLSCDLNPQCCQMAKDALLDLPIRFRSICADSRTVDWRKELDSEGRLVAELAYVDGDHFGNVPLSDIISVSQVIAPNGLILVHDYAPGQPDVVNAVADFLRESGWAEFFLPEHRGKGHYGACILQKPKEGVWWVMPRPD